MGCKSMGRPPDLSEFELRIARLGIPGRPVQAVLVSSTGSLKRVEESYDSAGNLTKSLDLWSGNLDASSVDQVRESLRAIWDLPDKSEDDSKVINNHLSVDIIIKGDIVKSIWLTNIYPESVRRVVELINERMPEEHQLYYQAH